jgi:hypothetical protein
LSNGFNVSEQGMITRKLLLDLNDTESIKLLSLGGGFATMPNNTWLSVNNGSGIKDSNFFADVQRPRLGTNSIPFISVLADSTSPFLTSFSWFDSNKSTFQLVFNEPILASSFNASAMFLGSTYADSAAVRLSIFTTASTVNGKSLTVTLGNDDVDSLDLSRLICFQKATCFISYEATLLVDINRNFIIPLGNYLDIGTIVLRQPVAFLSDEAGPKITNFSLNMNYGMLNLTFSKEIAIATFNPEEITLQSSQNISQVGSSSWQLMGGVATKIASKKISLQLLSTDILEIKGRFLATSTTNAYLSCNTIVQDLLIPPNNNFAVSQFLSLRADSFIPDTTAPLLISFDLQLDKEMILFTFNETILS